MNGRILRTIWGAEPQKVPIRLEYEVSIDNPRATAKAARVYTSLQIQQFKRVYLTANYYELHTELVPTAPSRRLLVVTGTAPIGAIVQVYYRTGTEEWTKLYLVGEDGLIELKKPTGATRSKVEAKFTNDGVLESNFGFWLAGILAENDLMQLELEEKKIAATEELFRW
jgi:hypothetical protein